MKTFFEKIFSFLHIRSIVAGLEVSDEVIRIVYFDGTIWQMHAIRLAPGIMERGIIKNRDVFVSSLIELKAKSKIGGGKGKNKLNVAVALSSATPYSKVFRLPEIEGESLEKAIELNLEMASPGPTSEFYSGWQIVGREPGSGEVDVLGAFMERASIDNVVDALFAAGYIAMSIESKALALTRVFQQKGSGIDIKKPYIMVSVDNSGTEFLVIRNGSLYFEYSHRWGDIENEKGEILLPAFEGELITSLRQVLNFYAEQWKDPVSAIVLATTAFSAEIEKTIAENATLPAVRLTLVMGQTLSSEWLVALGSSLRGSIHSSAAQEINFLGAELQDQFRAEEISRFLEFWRVIVPVALGILIVVFAAADVLLSNAKTNIQQTPEYALVASPSGQVENLIASSTAFNAEVALIAAAENPTGPLANAMIGDVQTLAAEQNIQISTMIFNGSGPISLTGVAPTEADILAFKDAMTSDTHISAIDLPLTGIEPAAGNYSFQMTFVYSK